MKAILALDQGTSSSRAILFDSDGSLIATAQREFRQIFPQPGWVEHDPLEIWESQRLVMDEVLAVGGLGTSEIAAIGITNQRETTILWDRATGEPIGNAIVWQDRRTSSFCEGLAAEASLFQRKTGLVLDPYFSGSKIRWMLDYIPEARERAERGELAFGTVDSWLIWKLSGGKRHVTDPSNASRTLLFNLREGRWDDELLAILKIPRSILPEIVPSSGVCAEVAEGRLARVPIAGVAGDQQAALFGQCCFQPGMAKNTYGTGCFLLMNTGTEPKASDHRLLCTAAWKVGGVTEYALEGSVFIGGAVVQWLRDGLGIIKHAIDIETLAATVPDNGGIYLVPAFVGLGAPHWDANARGAVLGITRGTTAGHFARAALEGIAFQCFDVLRAMEEDSGVALKELRVDGGASLNNLVMQFQADLLQVPVVRPKVVETTALGAAYLAGLAVGVWRSTEEIAQLWQEGHRFEPSRPAEAMRAMHQQWKRAVKRAGDWAETEP